MTKLTTYFIKNDRLFRIFELVDPHVHPNNLTDILFPAEIISVDYDNEFKLNIDNKVIELLKNNYCLNLKDDVYMIDFDIERLLKDLNIKINYDELLTYENYKNVNYKYSSYSNYEDTILDIAELV